MGIWDDIVGGAKEIGGLFTGDTSFSDLGDNFSRNWNELVSGSEKSSLGEYWRKPSDPFTVTAKALLDVVGVVGDTGELVAKIGRAHV